MIGLVFDPQSSGEKLHCRKRRVSQNGGKPLSGEMLGNTAVKSFTVILRAPFSDMAHILSRHQKQLVLLAVIKTGSSSSSCFMLKATAVAVC